MRVNQGCHYRTDIRGIAVNKQALSLAVFIAGAYPAASNALGLGDIESSSHLNQPLRAKIELLSGVPADASQIKVRLAPPDVFNRVGVARPEFLDNLQFTPTIQGGKPVILITSSTPIQEPFVNFLLEVSWPQGQLLKEYTVMLDPPVMMQPGNTVAGEATVRAEPKATGTVRRPAAPTQPSAATDNAGNAGGQAVAEPARPAVPQGSRTYRVRPGDTLFRVASRLQRPGISNDQMMMALFRANPNAFIDGNLNSLRSGVTLKAPSAPEVAKLSRDQARRQIRQHNADWRELRQSLAKNTVPQKATTPVAPTASTPAKTPANAASDKRLEVLGAKSGDAIAKDAAVASSNAKLADLEKQLSLVRESMTARQKENDELKSRVTDLESMLNKKNRLIALRNDQLASLQKQLSDNGITVPPLADMNENGDVVAGKPSTPAKTPAQPSNTPNVQANANKPADSSNPLIANSNTPAASVNQGKDIQTHMANVNGQGNNAVVRTDTPAANATNNTAINPSNATTTPPKPATPAPNAAAQTPAGMAFNNATTNGANPASTNAANATQNNAVGTANGNAGATPTTPVPPASTIKPVTPTPATPSSSTTPVSKPPVIPVAPLDAEKKPAPVFADQNKDGDILELLTSPLALQIGAGSLALLLLLWLLSRRRKPEDGGKTAQRTAIVDDDLGIVNRDNDLDDDFDLRSLEQELDKAEARDSKRVEADPFGLDVDNAWDNAPAQQTPAKTVQQTVAETANTYAKGDEAWQSSNAAEEDDLLTEANVYIAYGLYQQAESELKKGIERHPERLEYHHKLLECYFVANNREAFDRQAEQFAATNDKGKDELWKAVQEWGRKISPDNKLYQGGAAASGINASTAAATVGGVAAAALATAAFANDDADDEAVSAPAIAPVDSSARASIDDEFDFNLDELTLTEFDSSVDNKVDTKPANLLNAADSKPEAIAASEKSVEETNFDDLGDLDFDDIDLDKLLQDEDEASPTPLPVIPTVDAAAPKLDVPVASADKLDEKLADDFDDFDFDLMLDDEPSSPAVKSEVADKPAVMMDDELLDLDFTDVTPTAKPVIEQVATVDDVDDDNLLDFMLEDDFLDTKTEPTKAVVASDVNKTAEATVDELDFDLPDLDDLFADPVDNAAAPVVNGAENAIVASPTKSTHVANLNLHLDNNTGINRILPKDTFYAPNNGTDQDWLGDIDDALSFLDFPDEEIDLHEAHISTKLDLARAYLDMGDIEGARSTLEEVMVEGNDDQRREAEVLLHQTG